MTNGEKYKTTGERVNAFEKWCFNNQATSRCWMCKATGAGQDSICCFSNWLCYEVEGEKLMPCLCGGKMVFADTRNSPYQRLVCEKCGARTVGFKTKAEAIAAHNRVCKAVAAYKESKLNGKLGVGDVVAYRTCDDNDSEWRSFTVRLVEGGYLYEREDKAGDNIAIEFAHKVMVHN